MRYYRVEIPGEKEPIITTNARGLRNLPPGARVFATVTDYDGTLLEEWELPVENGRVKFPRRKRLGIRTGKFFSW